MFKNAVFLHVTKNTLQQHYQCEKFPVLSWLNPPLEGGPKQEGRVSCLLAGLQPY